MHQAAIWSQAKRIRMARNYLRMVGRSRIRKLGQRRYDFQEGEQEQERYYLKDPADDTRGRRHRFHK